MKDRVQELITDIREGRFLEAFEEFYAEEVVMAENENPPTIGKDANRQREIAWWSSVKEVHTYEPASVVVDDQKVVINWLVDYTTTEGQRLSWSQSAIQEWQDGRIVREQFVYDPASIKVAA